jgi:hypothetical protein
MKKKATKSISVPVHYVKGDKVWHLGEIEIECHDTCEVCLGDGTLTNSAGKEVRCSCHEGTTSESKYEWCAVEGKVTDICLDDTVESFFGKTDFDAIIEYEVAFKVGKALDYENFFCDELYEFKEAAEKEAKKRNKHV